MNDNTITISFAVLATRGECFSYQIYSLQIDEKYMQWVHPLSVFVNTPLKCPIFKPHLELKKRSIILGV